jgi:hypothetical protein
MQLFFGCKAFQPGSAFSCGNRYDMEEGDAVGDALETTLAFKRSGISKPIEGILGSGSHLASKPGNGPMIPLWPNPDGKTD